MKRIALIIIAGSLVAAPPAAAQIAVDKETIGQVLGGVGGALIGSQIGGGKGKLVAVTAGALGGLFVGGEIGKQLDARDRQGIAETGQQALNTGQSTSWTNPNTGTTSTARVTETVYRPAPQRSIKGSDDMVWQVPPMELIGADYVATTTSNVRGGPSTNYAVMDQIQNGERVRVVGKVVEKDWYMIERNGIGRGFVYGELLRRAPQTVTVAERPVSTAELAGVRQCSVLEQEVTLQDGTKQTRKARACQNADGTWELI